MPGVLEALQKRVAGDGDVAPAPQDYPEASQGGVLSFLRARAAEPENPQELQRYRAVRKAQQEIPADIEQRLDTLTPEQENAYWNSLSPEHAEALKSRIFGPTKEPSGQIVPLPERGRLRKVISAFTPGPLPPGRIESLPERLGQAVPAIGRLRRAMTEPELGAFLPPIYQLPTAPVTLPVAGFEIASKALAGAIEPAPIGERIESAAKGAASELLRQARGYVGGIPEELLPKATAKQVRETTPGTFRRPGVAEVLEKHGVSPWLAIPVEIASAGGVASMAQRLAAKGFKGGLAAAERAIYSSERTRKAVEAGIRRGEILTPEGEQALAAANAFDQISQQVMRPVLPTLGESAAREAQAVAVREAQAAVVAANIAKQREMYGPIMELRAKMARLRMAFGVEEAQAAKVAQEVPQTAAPAPGTIPGLPGEAVKAAETAVEAAPKLPRNLAGARPRYREQGVVFASDIDRALYIVAAPTRSKAHGLYMDWLKGHFPGLEEAAIQLRGQQVRRAVREASRDFEETIQLPETVSVGAKRAFREAPPIIGEASAPRFPVPEARPAPPPERLGPPVAEVGPEVKLPAVEPPRLVPGVPEAAETVSIPGVGEIPGLPPPTVIIPEIGAGKGAAGFPPPSGGPAGVPFRSMTEPEYTARAQEAVASGKRDVPWALSLQEGSTVTREDSVALRLLYEKESGKASGLIEAFRTAPASEKQGVKAALDEAIANSSALRHRWKESLSEAAATTQAAARASRIIGGSAEAPPEIVKLAQERLADRLKRMGTTTFDIGGASFEAIGAAKDLAIVGAWHIYRGARGFAAWSEAMVKDFGEGVTPYLAELFKDSQARIAADRLVEGGVPVTRRELERILARGVQVPARHLERFPDLAKRAAGLQLLEKGEPIEKLMALRGGVPETSIAEAAAERVTAANLAEGANVSRANLADSTIIGKYYLDRGYRNYSEWSAQMRQAVPSMSEETMKKAWLLSNERFQSARLIAEEAAKLDVSPEALTVERFLAASDADIIRELGKRHDASVFDKLITLSIVSKLTGLGNLLVRNPGSNLLMQMARVPDIELQALLRSPRFSPGAGVAFGKAAFQAMELPAKARATFDAVTSMEGLRAANTAFLDALDDASRNPLGKLVDAASGEIRPSFPVTYLESMPSRVAKRFLAGPGALLQWADAFTMNASVAGEASAELHSLIRNGLSPAEAAGSLKAFMASASPAQITRWEETARKLAFRAEPGRWVKPIEQYIGEHKILKLAIPFTRTMTNIGKIGWGLTPLRTLEELVHALKTTGVGGKEIAAMARARYSGANRARVLKDLTVANAGAFALYTLYVNGAVTGPGAPAGSRQHELEQILQNEGLWQPDSFNIGGTWFSYTDLGPMASAISSTVGAFEAFNRAKESKHPDRAWVQALSAQFRVVTDNAYTGFVRDLAKAFDWQDPSVIAPIMSAIRGMTVPPIVGNLARLLDPVQRQREGLGIQARIPIVSERLAPKVTGLGEPLEIPTAQALGIPNISRAKPETITQKLALSRIVVPLPKSVGGRRLTPQEVVAIAQERRKLLMPVLGKLMSSEWWAKADRIQRQAQVDRLSRKYLSVSEVYRDIKLQAAIQGLPVEQEEP